MAFDSHNLKLASQFKAIVLLVGFIAVQVSAESNKAEAEPLLIRGGWLFDGVSDTRRRNSGILIRDGKIVDLDITTDRGVQVEDGVLSTSIDDILENPEIMEVLVLNLTFVTLLCSPISFFSDSFLNFPLF